VTGFDTEKSGLHIQSPIRRLFPGSERGRVVASLLILMAVRVVYLLICPLELVPDEAYYWDWSRQLDWSYYSKPPLIAWLIALTIAVGGDSEFSIRLPAALLGTIGLAAVYELGRRMYNHRTGVWAMVIVAVSPGMTALCLLMTVDAPFLAAWTLAIYCLWQLFRTDEIQTRWLIPAVIVTGAGLLTKQTMFGLIPLTAIFLATSQKDRRKLAAWPFWTWALGSLACLWPVVWWNHSHNWITVSHTREHFGPQSQPLFRHLTLFLEFIATQFGVLSPMVCCSLLVVTAVMIRNFSDLPRRERFLICLGGMPITAVAILSFFQRVQPNWPVALHLTGVILLAAWTSGDLSLSTRLDLWRKWMSAGVALGAVLSLSVAIVPLVIPSTSLAGTKLDPTIRLRGWRELGNQVAHRMQLISGDQELLVVAATSRGPVSELAYYLPGKPRVYRWNSGEVIDSQHDVWGGPKNCAGRDALIITDQGAPLPERLANAFLTLEELDPIVVSLGRDKTRHFRVWRGGSLRAWPERSKSVSTVAMTPNALLP
jgi:4-amino-4-deoxy-L-arabinose transferase-like glycosyltransferase